MPTPKRLRYDPGHDLYVVVGASPTASPDELQRAFRQRAKAVHPDLHPENRQAKQQFQALNDAYDILSNPQKRAEYDRLRYDWLGYRGTPPPIREAFRDEWQDAPHDAPDGTVNEGEDGNDTGQPDFSEWERSRQPPSIFHAAWRNMMRSYSHRLLLAVLAFVLFANIAAVLLLPQVMWLFDTAAAAQAARTAEFYSTQTQANRPQFILVQSTPRPANTGNLRPSCANPNVRITAPADGTALNLAPFDIRGSADDAQFANYTIEIDSLSSGARWILSLPVQRPVRNGVLVSGVSIGNMTEGNYMLRLRVQLRDQRYLPACEVRIIRKK
jgi:hypothetical protein